MLKRGTRMKRSREVYQPSFMDHYDTIWGLIIYGADIDLKTAAKTSECCKLFHEISVSSDIAKCYWKFKILKCFKSYYDEDLLNKVNKTFKEYCYSYLAKVDRVAKKCEKHIDSLGWGWLLHEKRPNLVSGLNPIKEYLSETSAHKAAQYCLGHYMDQGEIESTHNESVKYYTLSADQGLLKAQTLLARYYDYGYGVPQDRDLCFKYFKLAADQQIKILSQKLKIEPFAEKGMSRRVNLKDAFQHYKALLNGEGPCDEKLLLNAARCHEEGIGTTVNVRKALNYYKVVKDYSYVISSLPVAKVATCYEHGIGTPKSLAQCIKYYKVWIKHPLIGI